MNGATVVLIIGLFIGSATYALEESVKPSMAVAYATTTHDPG